MMKTVVNIGLTGAFLALLILPVVGSHLLISFNEIPNQLSGFVAGVRDVNSSDVNILPNTKDFNGYATFNPSSFEDGVYVDEVTLNVFQRQKATYRGVYTIYNVSSSDSLAVQITSPGARPTDAPFDHAIVTIAGTEVGTELTVDTPTGSAFLEVAPIKGVHVGDMVLVGQELTEVVSMSPEGLIILPLKQDHVSGEIVYPQSVVLRPHAIDYPRTGLYVLQPGERAQVNIFIQGTASLLENDQKVTIPLEIHVTRD